MSPLFLNYAEHISNHFSLLRKKKKKNIIVEMWVAIRMWKPIPAFVRRLWKDEGVNMQSLCQLDILTHAAVISHINGLLQVNDQLCEGPFARNMDSVKMSLESRCCSYWAAHNPPIWLWRISVNQCRFSQIFLLSKLKLFHCCRWRLGAPITNFSPCSLFLCVHQWTVSEFA